MLRATTPYHWVATLPDPLRNRMQALIGSLLSPSSLLAVILICGLALAAWRKPRLSLMVTALATTLYVLLASGPVAHWLLGSLEYRYPPHLDPLPPNRPHTIVVLSAYGQDDRSLPLSTRLNGSGLSRVIETFLLAAPPRGDRIVVSGGGNNARVMRDLLVALGVPAQAIMLDEKSVNTYESARHLRLQLGTQPLYLVTSAGHMPRAMGVFEKQGMRPIAIPTDYFAARDPLGASLWPSAHHLTLSDLALHEYLGRLWYWLNDRL